MRRLVPLVAALVALVAVPAAHEASQSGSKIVYESYVDGDFELFAIDPDTRAVTTLTRNAYEDSSPTPSPDGTKVAFYSASGTAVVKTDGTGRTRLKGCTGYNLSWSPDSSRVACEGESSGSIVVVHADGTGAKQVPGPGGYAPSWSPDGSTIAYVGTEGIYTVSPDGTNEAHLTSHAADDLTVPVWSPDSKSILFLSEEPSSLRNDLYVVAADGSSLRRLATDVSTFRPAWSPDETLIAYTAPSAVKNASAIYTIAPDGTGKGLAAAGEHGESVVAPTWSPTGDSLAYVRGRFPGGTYDGDVFAVNREGIRVPVTTPFPSGTSVSSPEWAPGTLQNGEPPPDLHWLTLPKKRQLGGSGVLAALFASGKTAVAARQADCGLVTYWRPGKGGKHLNPCREADLLMWLALDSRSVAWVTAVISHTEFPQYLQVVDAGRKAATIASAEADPETGAGDYLGDLHGDGPLLAFNFWHESSKGAVTKLTSWRILPRGAKGAAECPKSHGEVAPGISARRCMRLAGGKAMRILSVSSDRIVGIRSGRTVRVLAPNGKLLRTQGLPTSIWGAQAVGSTLVVMTRTELYVYNLAGKEKAVWPLSDAVNVRDPYLLDVYGNYAAYLAGAVYVVRLSDGKTVPLQAEGQAPPVDAQIDKEGLFYLYNQLYTKQPGRILFLPMGELNTLFRAG